MVEVGRFEPGGIWGLVTVGRNAISWDGEIAGITGALEAARDQPSRLSGWLDRKERQR